MSASASCSRPRAAGWAAAIGVAAQLGLSGHASALPGLQRISTTSVSDSSTSKTVAARCPSGQRILGGGATISGGAGQVLLQQLLPLQTATDDRFVASAREDGTGFAGSWRLTTYALCVDPPPGYGILPSTSGPPSSNPTQNTLSFCIGQTEVGLGGRINNGAGQVRLTSLMPASNGSTDFTVIAAQEDRDGFAGAWNVTALAVCASVPAGFTTVAATSAANSIDKSATVTCPIGTRVHAAGAQLVPTAAGAVDPGLVIDAVAIDRDLRRVIVRAVEDETGTGANWAVSAIARCAR